MKKGVKPAQLDVSPVFDEFPNLQSLDFVSKRMQIISFFKTVAGRGLLNEEKHKEIKTKMQELLFKSTPGVLAENKSFAKLMQEKSAKSKFVHDIKEDDSKVSFLEFLKTLQLKISKDEYIQLKIKNELQLLFDQQKAY